MAHLACVTGGTGFVATELVKQLLEKGYSVRATVRDAGDAAKVEALLRLGEALPGAAWCRGLSEPRHVHGRGGEVIRSRGAGRTAPPPGSLELVEADLLTPGSFDAAVAGCAFLFHCASPFFIDAADPQAQLVEPAVAGTRNVLGQPPQRQGPRVVLTSSCAGGRRC